MSRVWGIDEPRHRHVDNVRALFSVKVNPRHPSMYDRSDENDAASCVLLTQLEAQLIASLLNVARAHLPSPKAVDQAVDLLTPKATR